MDSGKKPGFRITNIDSNKIIIEIRLQEDQQEKLLEQDNKEELDNYPIVLSASHISEILKLSRRKVYELMDSPDFPLIKFPNSNSKRVEKNEFFKWLKTKTNNPK
jgi:hypothetical protein